MGQPVSKSAHAVVSGGKTGVGVIVGGLKIAGGAAAGAVGGAVAGAALGYHGAKTGENMKAAAMDVAKHAAAGGIEAHMNDKSAVWGAIGKAFAAKEVQSAEPSARFTRLTEKIYHTSDNVVVTCACISSAVYLTGVRTATLKEAENRGATSFFLQKDHMEDREKTRKNIVFTYIQDRTKVEMLDTKETYDAASDFDAINVRSAGISGYVRKRHIRAIREARDVNAQTFQEELQNALDQRQLGRRHVEILETILKSGTSLKNPVAVCVIKISGNTLGFVAWAGTDIAKRPMDLMTDVSATPACCPLWYDMCPRVQGHSAMMAHVQGDFTMYNEIVQGVLAKHKCQDLIFTGHSLGGGCALLAHMITLGQVEAGKLIDERLKNILVRSIVFAAPMPFFQVPDDSEDIQNLKDLDKIKEVEHKVKEAFQLTSVNFVCGHDIVPRLPGHPEFTRPAVREIFRSLGTSALMSLIPVEKAVDLTEKVVKKFCDLMLSKSTLDDTFEALKGYEHFSTIRYVDNTETEINYEVILGKDFKKRLYEETRDPSAYSYYFLCHTWFPAKVFFNATAKS